ncbi:hypothetical protein ARAM_006736 [Aspergillus rambellii]|uniref:DUF7514 domain-containing protein n=1 Tax=Aspergillus rambellii TaxID=308745 RepID=A0A0F8WVJ3_9EURO|nr:hypothetical protein ARAM_006736 [Aspergillus rambellii]
MSFARDQGAKFWGLLINPDKSPSPLLEQLCLGIAQVMTTFDNYATTDLTPERLATFYRKVGGNYDVLFLDTKPAALSFIYQRLGCFHSIQPSADPYQPPSIPSLQPHGFVRWQTIQLLLDPDEHVRYLQKAVDRWNIYSQAGTPFPKSIPREAFPAQPDPEMIQWHETVSQQFEFDYWKKNLRSSPSTFGAYHNQFSQKETTATASKEEGSAPSHRASTPSHHRYSVANEMPHSPRHQRRPSAEVPQPASRKVHSTVPRRSTEFGGAHASPRAPSPPAWPKHAHHKPRGRERMSYLRPDSPEAIPGHSSSDASSEDSSSATREPTSPSPQHSGHYRHLSPPHSPHARRHSHEAYSRRPQRSYPRTRKDGLHTGTHIIPRPAGRMIPTVGAEYDNREFIRMRSAIPGHPGRYIASLFIENRRLFPPALSTGMPILNL